MAPYELGNAIRTQMLLKPPLLGRKRSFVAWGTGCVYDTMGDNALAESTLSTLICIVNARQAFLQVTHPLEWTSDGRERRLSALRQRFAASPTRRLCGMSV